MPPRSPVPLPGVDFNKYADQNAQAGREDTCYERKGSLCRDKRNWHQDSLPGLRLGVRGLLRRVPQPRQRGN